jgi:hypothetical protein
LTTQFDVREAAADLPQRRKATVCLDGIRTHLDPNHIGHLGRACSLQERRIPGVRNVSLDDRGRAREITMFHQVAHVRLDVRPRLPVKKIEHHPSQPLT